MPSFDEKVRILFVSTGGGLDYPRECLGIEDALQRGALRARFSDPKHHAFVNQQRLVLEVDGFRPQIFHLSAHGRLEERSGVPVLRLGEGAHGEGVEVGSDFFVRLVRLHRESVRLLYLNACFSAKMAREIVAKLADEVRKQGGWERRSSPGFACVGTDEHIDDDLACDFSAAFYRFVSEGKKVGEAFDRARLGLSGTGADDRVFLFGDRELVFVGGKRGPVLGPTAVRRDDSMVWMELEFSSEGDAVKVAGRGFRGERTLEHALGPEFSVQELSKFRAEVGSAISSGSRLAGSVLEQARALHTAIFQGQLQGLRAALGDVASSTGEPLLIRLLVHEPRLLDVPWEAACRSEPSHEFLASAADLVVARGVASIDPCEPREIRRALRVLPVLAVEEPALLTSLRMLLEEHVDSGAIELLEPIQGAAARNPVLFERIRAGLGPHVIHLLGEGGFDSNDNPCIRLAKDDHGGQSLLPVEVFADELQEHFGHLRLLYLEACGSGGSGAFAHAAELLARRGIDAVVAQLWPVKSEVARAGTQVFYRQLVGARAGTGDVGASVHAARRTLVGESAEGLSPVLYLRGPDTRLFDLTGRQLVPPPVRRSVRTLSDGVSEPLRRLAAAPFSAILGSVWDDVSIREIYDSLRRSFLGALGEPLDTADSHPPIHSLAQRIALVSGSLKLNRLFQKVLGAAHQRGAIPAIVDALAPLLRPGVHTTLLWLPLLEHALLRHHPQGTLYVIQPGPPGGDERRIVLVKSPGAEDWEDLEVLPRIDLDEVFVVLRLYGGYSPEQVPVLTTPQVTEDDHIQGLADLRYIIPPEWERAIMGWLRSRPVMCLGLSALDWRHRTLLRWLFDQRPPPGGSLSVLGESQLEDSMWATRGAGLPGPSSFVVVRAPNEDLIDAMRGART